MATGLIPYKGLSLFLAYTTVPILQLMLSSIWTYQQILSFLLVFTGAALGLSIYFSSKINYDKHFEPETAKSVS